MEKNYEFVIKWLNTIYVNVGKDFKSPRKVGLKDEILNRVQDDITKQMLPR